MIVTTDTIAFDRAPRSATLAGAEDVDMDGTPKKRELDMRSVLIVDGDARHSACVRACLHRRTTQGRVRAVESVGEALVQLDADVELLFVDTSLPHDGTRRVIDAAFRLRSSPVVVAMGCAHDPATTVFELAKTGVHAYLLKPLSSIQIDACIGRAHCGLESVRDLVRPLVGRFGLKDIQAYIRHELVREALARTGGSRRSAARVLGVTRPAVQKFLREVGLDE